MTAIASGDLLALLAAIPLAAPAQAIFRTTDLSLADWGLAALVASSVLVLDGAHKLAAGFGGGGRASRLQGALQGTPPMSLARNRPFLSARLRNSMRTGTLVEHAPPDADAGRWH